MSENEGSTDAFDRVNMFLNYMSEVRSEYFDAVLSGHMKLVSARVDDKDAKKAYTTFELVVPRSLCNGGGNLHGGAVALIFDMCTSMTVAPVSKEGFWDTGHVSRTLNCTYLRPAPEGTVLLVECELIHLGKTMGSMRGIMRRKDDGAVCYLCEHGKVKVEWTPPRRNWTPKESAKL